MRYVYLCIYYTSDRPSATTVLRKPLLLTTIRKFLSEFPVGCSLYIVEVTS